MQQDELLKTIALLREVRSEMQDMSEVRLIAKLDTVISDLENCAKDGNVDRDKVNLALDVLGRILHRLPQIIELIRSLGG